MLEPQQIKTRPAPGAFSFHVLPSGYRELSQALALSRGWPLPVGKYNRVILAGPYNEDDLARWLPAYSRRQMLHLPLRQGKEAALDGISKITWNTLADLWPKNIPVLIRDMDSLLLARKFAALGFYHIIDMHFPCFPDCQAHFSREMITNNREKILEAANLFSDEASLTTFFGKLLYRVTRNPLYLATAEYPEYMHPACQPMAGDCIIDAGAYDGDTARLFLAATGNRCVVHAFEPDPDNYPRLCSNIRGMGWPGQVKAHRLGLWHETTRLGFNGTGDDSAGIREGASALFVNVTALDSFAQDFRLRPSYIKFDVEGAELSALAGSRRVIAACSPRLAVCVYHQASDLWEIPLLIRNLHPGYRLFLGHHSDRVPHWDTVLYACVY